MHRFSLLLLLFPILLDGQSAKINPSNIDIIRDEYGVPHVFAPTDPEVAYGVAWVQSEDNFEVVQQTILFSKGFLGRVYGKDLAAGDFFAQVLDVDKLVEERINKDVSPEFYEYVDGYCQGMNAYAAQHPDEVLHKKLFPITPEEVIASYPTFISQFMGLGTTISRILAGQYDEAAKSVIVEGKGSNAFAFQRKMTTNDKTYLICNPHVNISGNEAFYEIHVASEEGLNFYGMLFPASLSPQIGTNNYLGWSHTNNYFDHTDVYVLEMHPTEKLTYKFDDQWEQLKPRKIKLKVKLKGIPFPIGVSRKIYDSKYGPTFESPDGTFYAVRMTAYQTIKTPEQWFRMNKATNFEEFQEALSWNGLPYFNITYADREDNVFYIFNGHFPDRNPGYDWEGLLPGNTSETLWTSILPLSERPQIHNPPCGYVYNVNHTPFKCTCEESWLDQEDYNAFAGFQPFTNDNLRSLRFRELYQDGTRLSMDELKAIKYDITYPKNSPIYKAVQSVCGYENTKYQPIIDALCNWDLSNAPESYAATYARIAMDWSRQNGVSLSALKGKEDGEEYLQIELMLQHIDNHLKRYFGKVAVPFKEFAKVKRGDIELPAYGSVSTLGNRKNRIDPETGKAMATGGDNGMIFVQYGENGVSQLETIVPFGSSNRPESPHYNDQMELYLNMDAKKATLDKEAVRKAAKRTYHPGE